MRAPSVVCPLLILAALLASAGPAAAQAPPHPGVRAAGMGGAFTGVADDASAVYWNPAGLASGSFFSLVVDRNAREDGSATLIALGTPPLGISYYRTASGLQPNGADGLVVHHAGVTLLQSLGDRFAVGGTLKAVSGVVSAGNSSVSSTKFDADLAVMATGTLGRIGLVVHNVAEPEFKAPGGGVETLERQVRAGLSVHTTDRTVAAADFDLTTTTTARGDWRELALGFEAHAAKKAWLRGGFHWNTAGDTAAPVGTLGGSFAVYGSTVADAQVSFGSADGDRGWGVGLRFVF